MDLSYREPRWGKRPASAAGPGPRCGRVAFSLLELMVVLSVVALLMALAAPSFLALSPARKTGAHELVGALESARARAAALGQDVHVAFADGGFPLAADRHRAYAFFTADPDADPAGEGDAAALLQISPWHRLPEGLVFGRSRDFEPAAEAPVRTLQEASSRKSFPVTVRPGSVEPAILPHLSFGSRGEVASPDFAEADALHLAVVEGRYDPGSPEVRLTRTRPGRSGGAYAQGELVGLNYYTGRASVLTD